MHAVHNARIQLLATALNNLAVGTMLVGVITPLVHGEIRGLPFVPIWFVLSLVVGGLAQRVLGRLL